jgi:hypothetical protein
MTRAVKSLLDSRPWIVHYLIVMFESRISPLVEQRRSAVRMQRAGLFRSMFAYSLLVVPVGLVLGSCGSDDKKGTGQTGKLVEVPVNPPCQNALEDQCGEECERDADCDNGLYCEAQKCTAQCTTNGGQCDGVCSSRGRCDGELRTTTVEVPPDSDDPIISVPSSGGVGAACATGSATATLANINMFLMFDQSSSMEENNRWENATAALVSFLQAPESAGIKIALRFFGSDEPARGCNIDDCSVEACSQPLIELGELTTATGGGDQHEQQLVQAIESRQPNPPGLGTPIAAALDGAVSWAEDFNSGAPDTERAVVVFVTDGEPTGCGNNTNTIAAIAGRGADNGVMTFAVGLQGSNENQMNAIAREGGSRTGIFVGDGNAQEDLLAALNAIRGQALACDFPLPRGENVDANKINVTFTPQSGQPEQWTKVNNEAACDDNDGWYFNDANNPTSVVLCPASCETASSDPDAKLEVILGCETNTPLTF